MYILSDILFITNILINEIFAVLYTLYSNPVAIKKVTSPIRLKKTALRPDLIACGRSYQKLINMKEHSPIPSHPI